MNSSTKSLDFHILEYEEVKDTRLIRNRRKVIRALHSLKVQQPSVFNILRRR